MYDSAAPAIEPAITNARPMYSSPVDAWSDDAKLASIASTLIPIGSTSPIPSRSQASQASGPVTGEALTVSIATAKSISCATSATPPAQIMRRRGVGDSWGVTRYQCPSSMAEATLPSEAADRTS